LGSRRHEQKRFGFGENVLRGVEEDSPYGIAERGATGLTKRQDFVAFRTKPFCKQTKLGRLAGALGTLEYDEPALVHSEMIKG
jgi:hypothetical protein